LRVNIPRPGRRGLIIVSAAAIEDEIGGKEKQRNVRREFREQRGGIDVGPPRKIRLRFAGGRVGQRRAMDDQLRAVVPERATDGVRLEQVEVAAGQPANAVGGGEVRRGLKQILADQPAGAGEPGEGKWFRICFQRRTI
jgi:hypothetical protein